MSSIYGENLRLSVFGQSHGPAIGMTLDGIPAGFKVDTDRLQAFLNRRRPGQSDLSTERKEEDRPDFLSGIIDGYTCGAPIAAVIRNSNIRPQDYSDLQYIPRPGHADYSAQIKYGGFQDKNGGGHFSGRLTAPLCIAGGLCKQWLENMDVQIDAHIYAIAGIRDTLPAMWDPTPQRIHKDFPVYDAAAGEAMREAIRQAKQDGDSVGGIIQCFVTGLPGGIGEPMFDGMESKLAHILFGIPAVKGVEFGAGFSAAEMRGSVCNDPIQFNPKTGLSNNAGGILGGISNGMPIVFRVGVKPTPSIAKEQLSMDLRSGEPVPLAVSGRHDPCIVPRAVPVVEAAAAVALFDLILGNTQTPRRK